MATVLLSISTNTFFWYFMSANVWHLNLTFGSFHIASSMVRLVFRPYTQVRRVICTSTPL
ncbi:conserved hypothetical protein, partial [Trichinella spiralis]|uniref:hypothetical protein n=1 Tax=Trichinella spiralis TaxID=6334 RepID=UPI0001EFDCB9